MDAMPRQISERWLRGRRQVLAITVKTLSDGSDNPAYTEIAAEIADAEAELARWSAFEAWVKRTFDLHLNSYPLRHAGRSFEPGKAFMRKDKAAGIVTVLAREEAWTKYQEASHAPTS